MIAPGPMRAVKSAVPAGLPVAGLPPGPVYTPARVLVRSSPRGDTLCCIPLINRQTRSREDRCSPPCLDAPRGLERTPPSTARARFSLLSLFLTPPLPPRINRSRASRLVAASVGRGASRPVRSAAHHGDPVPTAGVTGHSIKRRVLSLFSLFAFVCACRAAAQWNGAHQGGYVYMRKGAARYIFRVLTTVGIGMYIYKMVAR